MMKDEHSLFSEHIKGENNNIADILLRDFSFTRKKKIVLFIPDTDVQEHQDSRIAKKNYLLDLINLGQRDCE